MAASHILGFQGPNRWLSNFVPCSVDLDGLIYPTVEHAYQAAKTTDPVERTRIRLCPTPGQAKRESRKVTIRPDWDGIKLDVMRDLLMQKFTLNAQYRAPLLATAGTHIEEANTWGDRYWGTCNGVGQNNLGKLIMAIRNQLSLDNFTS